MKVQSAKVAGHSRMVSTFSLDPGHLGSIPSGPNHVVQDTHMGFVG